jgi:hypothetical protein
MNPRGWFPWREYVTLRSPYNREITVRRSFWNRLSGPAKVEYMYNIGLGEEELMREQLMRDK